MRFRARRGRHTPEAVTARTAASARQFPAVLVDGAATQMLYGPVTVLPLSAFPPEPGSIADTQTVPAPYRPRHVSQEPPIFSACRDGVQCTPRLSDFRFGIRCFGCSREFRDTNADGFAGLYAASERCGWRQDLFGAVWRCPRCARRYEASFGVHPIAAIEGGAA